MIKKVFLFIFLCNLIFTLNSYYSQANDNNEKNKGGGSSAETIKVKKSLNKIKKGAFAGNYFMRSQLTLTDAVKESSPWNVTGDRISKFGANSFDRLFFHLDVTNTYRDFKATLKLKDGAGNIIYEDSMNMEGGYDWWRFYLYTYSPIGNLNGQEIKGEFYVDNQYVNSISAFRTENPYRNLTVQANTSYKEQNNFTSHAKFLYLESAGELKAVLIQNGQVKKESSITTVELKPFYHYKEYNWYPSINNLPPGNFKVEFKAKFIARKWETMTSKNIVVDACTNVYYIDNDRDGYGNPSVKKQACIKPAGYVTNNSDCNDSNANIKPGAKEQCNGTDDNCNNQIDEGVLNACGKCGAVPTEICDGKDNDCDGSTDEGVKNIYYLDSDKDGFGNPNKKTQACSQPNGYVTNNSDCNDSNANIKPGAKEQCNGTDDNCNNQIDEGVLNACGKCGAVPTEICDGIDNDCDGSTDEGVKKDYYLDSDKDGFGNPNKKTQACSQPNGYVTNNSDCNDSNANIKPGAKEQCNGTDDNCNNQIDEGVLNACGKCGAVPTEICDGIDNDCDGSTDEGVKKDYYLDSDKDGFGNPNKKTQACSQPNGYVTNNSDCNDSNANIKPGAKEQCNGIDDNCNNQIDEGVLNACGKCGTVPTEICDGIDNDCDGITDEGVKNTYYLDSDGDNYGNPEKGTQACSEPLGFVLNKSDCNDNDKNINIDALEICNDIDDNCNGAVDDNCLTLQDIDVTPLELNFGELSTEIEFTSKTITITNIGDLKLEINNISLSNSTKSVFEIINNNCLSKTLSKSEACTLDINFNPDSEKIYVETIIINSNDPDHNSKSVTLRGSGVYVSCFNQRPKETAYVMDIYGSIYDENDKKISDKIEIGAFVDNGNNDEIMVGRGFYGENLSGSYGLFHIYGDDPSTEEKDGAYNNDLINLKICRNDEIFSLISNEIIKWKLNASEECDWKIQTEITQRIPLIKGWNLFSFGVNKCYYVKGFKPTVNMINGIEYEEVDNIASILKSIEGKYSYLWGFDIEGVKTYNLTPLSDMRYMAAGYGYWIKINEDAYKDNQYPIYAEFTGKPISGDKKILLSSKWNLTGYIGNKVQWIKDEPTVLFPSESTKEYIGNDIGEAFRSIKGSFSYVMGFDGIAKIYNLTPLSNMQYVGPGYGYWILVKEGELPSLIWYNNK